MHKKAGGGSGSLEVSPRSRTIARMRFRTARDSVGPCISRPSLVRTAFFLSSAADIDMSVLGCVIHVSASFSCQLVHALPYCPTTAYAVPLPAPPAQALAYDASNIPGNLTTHLLGYLTNFTTSLLTAACGRDLYSPLKTCADCQVAYRHWLCSISFPRCGEIPQTPASPGAASQQVLAAPSPALVPQASGTPQRNSMLGNVSTPYTALLPCIETCNAVDRACPAFLGFLCPLPDFTANASYGLGFIDSADGDVEGGGMPGTAQDRWGNVFCNAS